MHLQLWQTIWTKTSHICIILYFYLLSFWNKIQLTLRSCSMHYIKLRFNSFCINLDILIKSLMQFQYQKSASYQIAYIFNIQHNSSISICCEYTSDKVLPLDFICKRKSSTQHQKAEIHIIGTLQKVHAK